MNQLELITAVGANTDLVLQLVDFFNGGERFRYNREGVQLRDKFRGRWIGNLHLVVTEGVREKVESLQVQLTEEYPEVVVHIIPLPCEDISCTNDDESMRDLVYASVEQLAGGNLIISSGGRKTLTNRLIEAGLRSGCLGYLTLTAPFGNEKRTSSEKFSLLWTPTRDFIKDRQQILIKDKLGDNFRSLYLLPAAILNKLHEERIGVEPARANDEVAWLKRLPKADLHCHLGGAYDIALLQELANALLEDCRVSETQLRQLRVHLGQRCGTALADLQPGHLRKMLPGVDRNNHCLKALELILPSGPDRFLSIAALISALEPAQLEGLVRDGRPAQIDWPKDIDWYMACGDLGGSSLLQTTGNLRRTLSWLMHQAKAENIQMLEVRFSPDNYTRNGLDTAEVVQCLREEAKQFCAANPDFLVNFIIMATRHKDRAAMNAHVAAAIIFGEPGSGNNPRITGFDLAGQEKNHDPARFADIIKPLHYHFMNITIHAGEMEEEDKIWQAIYLLHAKRIGHGLKLVNNRKMMNYVRDYGIAIEMCPSSNCQTNAFRLFDHASSGDIYPLRDYFNHGILVTLNTDNRGISATTLTDEYMQAARLTEGGLSKWEVLRLIKNGFKAAFLPKDQKDQLLKRIDKDVFEFILNDFFPE